MTERLGMGLQERCVICVDDDREFLKSLEFFLPEQINRSCPEGLSYRFLFMSEPLEALETMRQVAEAGEAVAMVISDQQMPNMKGTEFMARARELAPDCIRVLLTGHSGIDAAILGINDQLLHKYLTKPIESEHEFVLSVKQLLDRFELDRKLQRQSALLRGLYDFANNLNATRGVDAAVHLAVEFTKTALPCNEARVILAPPAETEDPAEAAPDLSIVPDAVDNVMRAPTVETGIVGRVEDCPWYEGMGYVAEGAWAPGPVAYAVLGAGDSAMGLLLAWEPVGGPQFGDETVESLRYIAASASIAIENRLSQTRLEDIARARARSLEEARARLQILDRLKTDFLSFVSHELRTPLNHMSAVGMLEDEMDPKDRVKMVAVVRTGYERLERFIMSSLEYFEWFSARREACTEVTNMTELVEARVAKSRVHDTVPIEWNMRLSREPCLALFPRACAEKLLGVLIDNSVKFSMGHPSIRINLSVRAGWVTLVIADRGRGFPPEWASEIFRPFTIADPMHHREGTALSLAKAAAMVEAYGGRIRAESAGPDQGATFIVDLPVKTETRSRLVEVKNWRAGAGRSAAPTGPDDVRSEAA